jgi:predicted ribosomally synthesized peptide with SipW-like signal peptide
MKKRSILTLVLSLVLVAAVSVGATLAYLTSTQSAVNTFTVGNVTISQTETGGWGNNDPAHPEQYTNSTPLVPGVPVSKVPVVTVGATSQSCYVFMKVAFGTGLESLVTLDINPAWHAVGASHPGVYAYYVTGTAAQKVSAGTPLPALFTTVTAKTGDTNEDLSATGLVKTITVSSFAIQSEGISGVPTDHLPTGW